MFFVIDGTVVVRANRPCALKQLDAPDAVAVESGFGGADKVDGESVVTKGDVFGEGGLFPVELGPCRRETVFALTWVSVYTLSNSALWEISASYPEVSAHIPSLPLNPARLVLHFTKLFHIKLGSFVAVAPNHSCKPPHKYT